MNQPIPSNPILGIKTRIPFDELRPEHFEPAIEVRMEEAQAVLDAIATLDVDHVDGVLTRKKFLQVLAVLLRDALDACPSQLKSPIN